MITKETLEQSIQEARQAVQGSHGEVSRAQSRLAEAERELKLLAELARLRGWEMPGLVDGGSERAQAVTSDSSGQSRGRTPSPTRTALLSAVIEILAERGTPMQIRELMDAVQQRGVAIPGSGQQANLIAHISRDDRIVRPQRGFYGLREWGISDVAPKQRKRRRRARRRTGATA